MHAGEVAAEDADADQLHAAQEEHRGERPERRARRERAGQREPEDDERPQAAQERDDAAEVCRESQRDVRERGDRFEREAKERRIGSSASGGPPGASVIDRDLLEADPGDHAAEEATPFRHATHCLDDAPRHESEVTGLSLIGNPGNTPRIPGMGRPSTIPGVGTPRPGVLRPAPGPVRRPGGR